MEMGMKTLVLLLLSVVATNWVHSLPTNAEMGEEQDAEGLFSLFWGVMWKINNHGNLLFTF